MASSFSLRLSLVSLFTLILALVWAGYGFKQESERVTAGATAAAFPDLYEASIAELQTGLEKGQFTSVDLVKVWPLDVSTRLTLTTTTLTGIFRAY